jgi:putative hydrolase of the HAD superfamily
MAVIQGIVFDLDDTLYLEREYVQSGFNYVSKWLQKVTTAPSGQIFNYLWNLFEQGVRGSTFNELLNAYPELSQYVQVKDIIQAYRTHMPEINLLPDMPELAYYFLDKGFRLGLLSDGAVESQRSKLKALELEALFKPLVLTDVWGQEFWKPHPKGYKYFEETWGLQPHELAYIGDNPEKDFATPRCLGWYTIRMRVDGQIRFTQEPPSPSHAADSEISNLGQLIDMLE